MCTAIAKALAAGVKGAAATAAATAATAHFPCSTVLKPFPAVAAAKCADGAAVFAAYWRQKGRGFLVSSPGKEEAGREVWRLRW